MPRSKGARRPGATAREARYHGIFVQEGLSDPAILRDLMVVGRKQGANWTLLRVEVGGEDFWSLVAKIQSSLKVDGGIPYYAHFYRPGELVVIFPKRVFRIAPETRTWGPAVEYGRSKGIPPAELDFAPCRYEDESF